MAIQQLPSTDSLTGSDKLPLYSSALGLDASTTVAQLAAYLTGQSAPGAMVTQYASPNATGFSISINATGTGVGQSVWLLVTPLAGYAAGTIVLPPVAICQDQQELLVSCTQAVTTLTVSGNGAPVNGAPTTLTANAAFCLKFDAVNQSWYKA